MKRWIVAGCAAGLFGAVAAQGVVQPPEHLNPEDVSGYAARQPVPARHVIVVTASPLATKAGYRMLQAGGSAVDALPADRFSYRESFRRDWQVPA